MTRYTGKCPACKDKDGLITKVGVLKDAAVIHFCCKSCDSEWDVIYGDGKVWNWEKKEG